MIIIEFTDDSIEVVRSWRELQYKIASPCEDNRKVRCYRKVTTYKDKILVSKCLKLQGTK